MSVDAALAHDRKDGARRCALIVGHPGHELRVWSWMRSAQPVVTALTDGSGHGVEARVGLTCEQLRVAGALPGPDYGVVTDRQIYAAMLTQDLGFFLDLADRLSAWLIESDIDCVVGDAIEGYNPTHDVCRLLIDHAVRRVEAGRGRAIENLQFSLVGSPIPAQVPDSAVHMMLEPGHLAVKIADARQYARAVGGLLVQEIEEAFAAFGEQAFQHEVLLPSDTATALSRFENSKPFYEQHGEKQVAAGLYQHVIRYHEHIAPIARCLQG